jgi:hypothetical protein
MLLCGSSLALACAVDNRPGRVVKPSENDESGDPSGKVSAGSAGASDQLPGGSVPAATGEGPPNPALSLNGGGGASGNNGTAGSASMMMAGSGASGSPSQGTSGASSSGATGSGNIDPGETEAVGGCFNQLLSNGGFDRGHAGWGEISEAVHDVIIRRDASLLLQAGVTPQSGDYLAWIGGIRNGDFQFFESTLTQEVAVPAETLSLTFSGYYWVSQPELGRMPSDAAVLEIEDPDPNGYALWQLEWFDDQDVSQGWVPFEATTLDVARFAGKTVQIKAYARPNANGTLSVWLDSLRFEARCAR